MKTSDHASNLHADKATCREWMGLAILALPCILYAMDLTVLNPAVSSLSADRRSPAWSNTNIVLLLMHLKRVARLNVVCARAISLFDVHKLQFVCGVSQYG